MTTIPKKELVTIILENVATEEIRSFFHIKEGTDLRERLQQMLRRELIRYLMNEAGPAARDALRQARDRFPLKAAPTLYVVNLLGRPSLEVLGSRLDRLVEQDRDGGLVLPDNRAVRIVYLRSGMAQILDHPAVYEFTMSYERRVEYVEGNPESTQYGETACVWALDNALFWFPGEDLDRAILSCTDWAAVQPILTFLRAKVELECSLPDLTAPMMRRVVEGARPRSATFSAIERPHDGLDVRTLTAYDDHLEESELYRSLGSDPRREQTSGYYVGHQALTQGGLGVARRYARIWTPRHLDRTELTRLALGILTRTNEEVARLRADNLRGYVSVYARHPMLVGDRLIEGAARRAASRLVELAVLASARSEGVDVPDADLRELLSCATQLGLQTAVVYECPNCGVRNARCPHCSAGLVPVLDPAARARCPDCGYEGEMDADHSCDCGERVPILNPLSHVFLCPSGELMEAISRHAALIREHVDSAFVVRSGRALAFSRPASAIARTIRLSELRLWRLRAHLHAHDVANQHLPEEILMHLKEKCVVDEAPPTLERCGACLGSLPSQELLLTAGLCLPRVFGIPISQGFNGIHHRYEGADIIYEDQLDGSRVRVGIHVKAQSGKRPGRPLGRSNSRVKALYAQVCFSLYQVAAQQLHLDVLGVAIPNHVTDEVVGSMSMIAQRFGTGLLVVDRDDWIRIVDLAHETLTLGAR